MVRSSPFQGENLGSTPGRAISVPVFALSGLLSKKCFLWLGGGIGIHNRLEWVYTLETVYKQGVNSRNG